MCDLEISATQLQYKATLSRHVPLTSRSCLSFLQVVCVGSFSQTLRRYTSLNHLAQAARAVLHNSAQISQMLSDLNRVDFTNVQVWAACFSLPTPLPNH